MPAIKKVEPILDRHIALGFAIDANLIRAILQSCLDSADIEYWATPDQDDSGSFTTFATDGEVAEIRITLEERVKGFNVDQTINAQTVVDGVLRMLSGKVQVNKHTLGNVLAAIHQKDGSVLDADDVDMIIQLGLFSAIVFG